MFDIKLKMIEEKLYEEICNTMEECEVPLMFACSVLKNIENRFNEKAIAELSFRLLKKENEDKENKENG